ncbi:MAG: hypothetical protein AAB709_00025 [Patescibacteria group bacterium]
MQKNQRKGTFVPATLLSGATALINTSMLPKKDWKTHSGFAPVAKEDVHSLQSQDIAGTKDVVIKTDTGAKLCVTQGEAEVFAADYLTDRGYKIQAPQ